MQPTRIACVRYLNTTPLIEGLDKLAGLTLCPMAPSRIVDQLVSGEVDIGLASIVDALAAPRPLALIPVGMIGSDGPTLTVRVFSGVPLESVTTIHADSESHTSVVLARLLFAKLFGAAPRIVSYNARERVPIGAGAGEERPLDEAWPETLLLIGDKVVTEGPPAIRYPYQLDLGEAWKKMTGLPFVYAMWMCREEDATRDHVRTSALVLDRQLRHNLTRLDWIVSQHAPRHHWPLDLARRYLGSFLRYRVGASERQGLALFLDHASRLGLIPRGSPRWCEFPAGTTTEE